MGAGMQLSDRIGRRIKLHDLHLLLTVVQAGSMSKAAALLHTTQSAISRSISELEQTIGVRLLDRGPHGVEPTQYGRTLIKHGLIAFDELKQGVKNIEFLADPTAGEVRIGSIPPLVGFGSAVIDRLSRRHPRIVFRLVTGRIEALHRELSERSVDLLITRRLGPMEGRELAFETLYEDPFLVVAGAQNPWVRRRKIELTELVNEAWVLPEPESAIGEFIKEAFRANGLDYPRATVVTLPVDVFSLIATGRFLGIAAASTLRLPTKHSEIKALPVQLPLACVPNGIVTLKNRTLSPVAQLFIEHAREVAKPLARLWRK